MFADIEGKRGNFHVSFLVSFRVDGHLYYFLMTKIIKKLHNV